MENDNAMENGELKQDEVEVRIEPVDNPRIIKPAKRINPIQGLMHNLKGIKGKIQKKLIVKKPDTKPIKNYGLGAYPPPQITKAKTVTKRPEIMKVFFPKKSVEKNIIAAQSWGQENLFNNCFFDTLLMVIIIYFLLRWLFGFGVYGY